MSLVIRLELRFHPRPCRNFKRSRVRESNWGDNAHCMVDIRGWLFHNPHTDLCIGAIEKNS